MVVPVRFLIHLEIGYPKREDEVRMLMAHHVQAAEARPMIDAPAVIQGELDDAYSESAAWQGGSSSE